MADIIQSVAALFVSICGGRDNTECYMGGDMPTCGHCVMNACSQLTHRSMTWFGQSLRAERCLERVMRES